MVKNLPWDTEDAGATPGQATKILHAGEQLSPHTTTTALCLRALKPSSHS